MKHNLSINYRNCLLVALCCMVVMPGIIYALEEPLTLKTEQEQYILERTGDILVKIYGYVESDGRDTSRTQVVLTHTTPDGESQTHFVRTNNQGYYEFYFVHNWDSTRGTYDINVNNEPYIADVTYELIEDPSYKSDSQVKQEYWAEKNNERELISTVVNAWEYYEGNKTQENYWMKNLFHCYYIDRITEEEVIDSIQYLVTNEILKLD